MQDPIPMQNMKAQNSYDFNFNPSDPSESIGSNFNGDEMSDMSVPLKNFDY